MPDPDLTRPGTAVAALRAATAADHQRVDQGFSRFDLACVDGYGRFLTAHALALPGIEATLATERQLPPLRPRAPLIAADLAALGLPCPYPLACVPMGDPAEAFGMAYVIEGSRLGGALIARSLPDGWPRAYLSATHQAGEWRNFLISLEEAATDDSWISRAIRAAKSTFDRYAESADAV